ncbi:hypothetical protein GQ457_18G004860 [Hibiscus cannabinus]
MSGEALNQSRNTNIKDLDFEVLDEDVQIISNGALLEIRFSEKVHSLLNMIETLWKHMREIKFIDLDNEYYLIRAEPRFEVKGQNTKRLEM